MGGQSHPGVPLVVTETVGSCLCQAHGGGRIGGRHAAVDPILEPLSDAAEIEGNGWEAEAAGLETHESEWLRPDAGYEQQIGVRQDAIARVGRQPACKLNGQPWHAAAAVTGLSSQSVFLASIADDGQRDGPIEAIHESGSGVDRDVDTFHPLQP